MSMLKAAGLYNDYYDRVWKRQLKLPSRYMTDENSVAERGFWSFVLWRYNGRWASTQESNTPIDFWDPQLMYDWVHEVAYNRHSREFKFLGLEQKRREQKSLVLVFDKRSHRPPKQRIWQKGRKN